MYKKPKNKLYNRFDKNTYCKMYYKCIHFSTRMFNTDCYKS